MFECQMAVWAGRFDASEECEHFLFSNLAIEPVPIISLSEFAASPAGNRDLEQLVYLYSEIELSVALLQSFGLWDDLFITKLLAIAQSVGVGTRPNALVFLVDANSGCWGEWRIISTSLAPLNYLGCFEFSIVSVWVGRFTSRLEFDDLMMERINVAEGGSLSKFAEIYEIGCEGWYDHDFIIAHYSDTELTVTELLSYGLWTDSYAKQLLVVADSLGIVTANAIVFLLKTNHVEQAVSTGMNPYRFLGNFNYWYDLDRDL